MQASLPNGGSLLPIIFFADQKLAVSFGTLKFHPVSVTVGVLPLSERLKAKNWELVAYFPVLDFPEADSKTQRARDMRQGVYSAAYRTLLESIKIPGERQDFSRLSWKKEDLWAGFRCRGVVITDSTGAPRTVFPRYCYSVKDLGEAHYETCTRSGNSTAFPCGACLCPNTELHKRDAFYPLRTSEHMKFAYEAAQTLKTGGNAGDAETLLAKLSLRDCKVM